LTSSVIDGSDAVADVASFLKRAAEEEIRYSGRMEHECVLDLLAHKVCKRRSNQSHTPYHSKETTGGNEREAQQETQNEPSVSAIISRRTWSSRMNLAMTWKRSFLASPLVMSSISLKRNRNTCGEVEQLNKTKEQSRAERRAYNSSLVGVLIV